MNESQFGFREGRSTVDAIICAQKCSSKMDTKKRYDVLNVC